MKSIWQNLINITLITSICVGCAAIPGKNVKLENYPELKEVDKNLGLSFEYLNPDKLDEYHQFNQVIGNLFKKNSVRQSSELNKERGCSVKVHTKNEIKEDGFCEPYFAVTFFTLFIVPFYCQEQYQANASLISYPKDSEIHGTIKTSINEAKLGDIFLDENNQPAKLLKTYELKDKVHEVWSSLWMLSWLVVEPNKYAPNAEYPKDAEKIMKDKISEALVRQVLHDASTFEECRKK